jgi:hypothetical protein
MSHLSQQSSEGTACRRMRVSLDSRSSTNLSNSTTTLTSNISPSVPKPALRACSETSIGFASGCRDTSVRTRRIPINTGAGSTCGNYAMRTQRRRKTRLRLTM